MNEGFLVPRLGGGEEASEARLGLIRLYECHIEMQLKLEQGVSLPKRLVGNSGGGGGDLGGGGMNGIGGGGGRARTSSMNDRSGSILRSKTSFSMHKTSSSRMSVSAASLPAVGAGGESKGGLGASSGFGGSTGTMSGRTSGERRSMHKASVPGAASNYIFFECETAQMPTHNDPLELYFALWSSNCPAGAPGGADVMGGVAGGAGGGGLGAKSGGFITEEFAIKLSSQGLPLDVSLIGKLKTVFADLEEADLDHSLHLVCFVYRHGPIEPKNKKQLPCRRPYGVGVLPLGKLIDTSRAQMSQHGIGPQWVPDQRIPIYTSKKIEKGGFRGIHLDLIKAAAEGRAPVELEVVPQSQGVSVVLRLLHADLAELQKGELAEILDGAGLTPRSFFGQVVSPGDMRNEMYVKHVMTSRGVAWALYAFAWQLRAVGSC